jgi:leucyl/phenylalanyl-tRNA--protein transferase
LAYLVHRLQHTGFGLFDTQFITPHLKTLGAEEIPQKTYMKRLYAVIGNDADFRNPAYSPDVSAIAQRNTQTS